MAGQRGGQIGLFGHSLQVQASGRRPHHRLKGHPPTWTERVRPTAARGVEQPPDGKRPRDREDARRTERPHDKSEGRGTNRRATSGRRVAATRNRKAGRARPYPHRHAHRQCRAAHRHARRQRNTRAGRHAPARATRLPASRPSRAAPRPGSAPPAPVSSRPRDVRWGPGPRLDAARPGGRPVAEAARRLGGSQSGRLRPACW